MVKISKVYVSKHTLRKILEHFKNSNISLYVVILSIAMVFIYCDIYFLNSRYIGLITKVIMDSGVIMLLFFEISYLMSQNMILTIFIFKLIVVVVIIKRFYLRKFSLNRSNITSNYICLFIKFFRFTITLTISLVVILHVLFGYYLYTAIYQDKLPSLQKKYMQLHEKLIENKENAKFALHRIMHQVEKEPDFLEDMGLQKRIDFCKNINSLVDRKGGIETAEEHYFRNKLNYAPENIDIMIETVRLHNELGWRLMNPEESALHMWGENGEFNLKFVSANGIFEAVYNFEGNLLTEESDAINMGTYNYANPSKSIENHILYDVMPYFEFGNASSFELLEISKMPFPLTVYRENKEAQLKYAEIKLLIDPVH